MIAVYEKLDRTMVLYVIYGTSINFHYIW